MIEVKNRSAESWGPLADCDDKMFKAIINTRQEATKDHIKVYLKRQKKLKTYKVTFERRLYSDKFEIQAESDWDIGSAAREYFKQNSDTIGFNKRPPGKWADEYSGYDAISYVKVKK